MPKNEENGFAKTAGKIILEGTLQWVLAWAILLGAGWLVSKYKDRKKNRK